MLSNDNIRRINAEIDDRLDTMSRFIASEEEKEEARKDLIVLNDLLLSWKDSEKNPPMESHTIMHIATELRRLFSR